MLKDSFSPRLLKKVQMQGGAPGTHPEGWVQVRGVLSGTPQRRASAPGTRPEDGCQQMGLFQQPARPGARAGGRGVTLIETMISSVLFAFVIAGVYSVYTTMQGTLMRGELKSDLQQNARIGLGRMVSEIRMAGNDPSGYLPSATPEPRAAIRAASANCLSFIASDETGVTKQVTYLLDGTTLKRNEQPWAVVSAGPPLIGTFTGGAGAQPVAESVASIVYTYYDEYNKVIAPVSWTSTHTCPPNKDVTVASARVQLTYWQMRQIRRIAISLRTQDSRPGVAPDSFTLTTDVRLRNR
jgi:hypothetical protein